MDGIMKPICCIYANCQAGGLAHFLAKAAFPYDIEVFHNYQLILGEQSPAALKESASRCDLFIYQPTREMKHGELSAEYYIEKVIPKHARAVSFAYQYNYGFFPLIGHGDGVLGTEYIESFLKTNSLHTVLGAYDQGVMDFGLWPRFLYCAHEQAKREMECDIKMTDWIVQNRHKRLFLTFNHPCSILFAALAERVMEHLGFMIPPIQWSHYNEANLPCEVPMSPYVINKFGWWEEPSEHAAHYYRALLEKAWHKVNSQPVTT